MEEHIHLLLNELKHSELRVTEDATWHLVNGAGDRIINTYESNLPNTCYIDFLEMPLCAQKNTLKRKLENGYYVPIEDFIELDTLAKADIQKLDKRYLIMRSLLEKEFASGKITELERSNLIEYITEQDEAAKARIYPYMLSDNEMQEFLHTYNYDGFDVLLEMSKFYHGYAYGSFPHMHDCLESRFNSIEYDLKQKRPVSLERIDYFERMAQSAREDLDIFYMACLNIINTSYLNDSEKEEIISILDENDIPATKLFSRYHLDGLFPEVNHNECN